MRSRAALRWVAGEEFLHRHRIGPAPGVDRSKEAPMLSRGERGARLAEIGWLTDGEEVAEKARSSRMPVVVDFFKDG